MMEEDETTKIAEELQEAASTNVSQEDKTKNDKATNDLNLSSFEYVGESNNQMKPNFPLETLVTSVGKVSLSTDTPNPNTNPPLPSNQSFSSQTPPTPQSNPSFIPSYGSPSIPPTPNPSTSDPQNPTPPPSTNQIINPYRAKTSLSTHVAPSNLSGGPKIYMQPGAPSIPLPTPPQPLYPSSQPSQGGESFLEIPGSQDISSCNYVLPQQKFYESNEGLLGWVSNVGNKVIEKTKHSVESMITTLDPGMKAVIYSGGDINIIVGTMEVDVVDGVRMAFQEVFGKATVNSMNARSDAARQPVGVASGVQAAKNKIDNLRNSSAVHKQQVVLSVEFFIQEIITDKWYDQGIITLKDPLRNLDLLTFTQMTPINIGYIQQIQQFGGKNYDLSWSGFPITIGEMINRTFPHIQESTWHEQLTSVSRKQIVYMATKSLATIYKAQIGV